VKRVLQRYKLNQSDWGKMPCSGFCEIPKFQNSGEFISQLSNHRLHQTPLQRAVIYISNHKFLSVLVAQFQVLLSKI
jgi:hypothetical protein